MALFIFAVAALILVTLFSLLRPWWRKQTQQRRVASADFPAALNTMIHRDRLAELERDHKNGVISTAGYAQAQEELQRQLLDDTAQPQDVSASGAKSWRDGLILAAVIPLLAVGVYLLIGNPAGLSGQSSSSDNAKTVAQVNALIAKLEEKMQQTPDNPQGWAMLARAYKLTGRLDDAELALGRIGPALNQNATLLADLAEILAEKSGRLAGRPAELILQALQLEPDNVKALYLAGAAAYEEGQYKTAIAHWEKLQQQVDPQSTDASNIAAGIAKAREMSGEKVGAGETAKLMVSPVASPAASPAKSGSAMASPEAVSGRVELSPALRSQTTPNETVFIFARAVNGPRMPLAVQRARVADLPLDFHLDDSLAMAPENKISTAQSLRVEVRISKSGQAMPEAGDLTGSSSVVKPGTKNVQVVIDQVVK